MKKCPKCGKTYEGTNTLCPNDGAVLVKSGDALIGKTLAGKYRIEDRISEGGMGTVYRATHVLMEKTVAIKVLHPSLAADDKIVARFTREAKAASRISHPHALTVTDFGEAEDGVVFLVMEYLGGQTLKQVVRSEGPMPLARVVEIARQIGGALDAAHAEGVVHRDLKSDNIMLTESGGGDWAKVLDFGIAKIKEREGDEDPELTAPNLIIGTPQYMSPEQCSQAHEIDARSDIYSFGVILFEMLAGHVPFTGESATAIMLKHLQEPPPSVLAERSDLPPAVGQVIARALAKRPEDRQQSAGELVEALALAASSKAVAAPTTGENRAARERDTNRIVVPTAPFESRTTENDDYDEATVVRPNAGARTPTGGHEIFDDVMVEPPSAARFNPWVVIIPAAALLIALLGIFYIVNRNSPAAPASNDNSAPLSADPNAVPAQTAQPPTGAGESNITSAQPTAPTPSPTGGAAAGVPGADVTLPTTNANVQGTPALVEENKDNRNANSQKTQPTDNPDPTPPPSTGASPQRSATPQPSPKPTVRDTNDDPPPPTPRKTATPPPTPPKSGAAQQAPAGDPPPPFA
jgi:serine/threonine-protein kinase